MNPHETGQRPAGSATERKSLPPSTLPIFRDVARLEAERRRLIGYCARFTNGDRTAADEIAQETLALAWEDRDRLRSAEAWQSWLTGIARNLCLRWRQRTAIDARRRVGWESVDAAFDALPNPAAPDPLLELERGERTQLIDRALSALPRTTHALLIERYVDDLPVAEIAARRGLREDTANVQLFRGRAALKKVLSAPSLRDEAIALGLISPIAAEAAEMTETRLWCPRCGTRRLNGYFGKLHHSKESEDAVRETVSPHHLFLLRCGVCDPDTDSHQSLILHIYDANSRRENILRGVKGYRAAYKRLAGWWHLHAENAVHHETVACYYCGLPVPVQHDVPEGDRWASADHEPGLFTHCTHCLRRCYLNVTERSFMVPALQQFWSENPRSRLIAARHIDSADGPAYVTRLESVTGNAAVEVLTDAKTLALRGTYPIN